MLRDTSIFCLIVFGENFVTENIIKLRRQVYHNTKSPEDWRTERIEIGTDRTELYRFLMTTQECVQYNHFKVELKGTLWGCLPYQDLPAGAKCLS